MNNGDFIKINYIGTLENGETFDITYEDIAKNENIYNPKIKYGPIPVIIGAGFVIKGVDDALLQMKVGERKVFSVEAEKAFGERDPKLVRILQKKIFKDRNVEPRQGMIVDFSGMKGRIQSVDSGRVRVDFNNPLAGKSLKYDIKIEEKVDDPESQIKMILDFFGINDVKIIMEKEVVTMDVPALPLEMKERVGSLITTFVVGKEEIKTVKFVETFQKSIAAKEVPKKT